MSTNYYASITAEGDETTPVINLHLGKTSNDRASVDGNMFASFKDMLKFLTYNEVNLTITSETGIEYNVEGFANLFYATSPVGRSAQYDWVMSNSFDKSRTWLDDEGFSMSKGSWS